MDYFYFFIYRAQELLKVSGSLCYLTSNYFFTADGAKKLREFIKQHFPIGQVLDFTDTKVFKVKVHACIFTAHQNVRESNQDLHVFDELAHVKSKLKFDEIFDFSDSMSLVTDEFASAILHKVHQHSKTILGDLYEVKQGIVSGADRVGEAPCFVYKNHELVNIPSALKPYVHPFYKNSAIKHFSYEPNTEYSILYLNRENITELELKEQLDFVKSHLNPFKTHLQKRREVENNVRHWYELTWPRDESIFSAEKIVAPQRARSNYFAYSKSAFYASADVYFMIPKSECNFEPKIMSLYLNSSIAKIYLYFKGKKKGKSLELYSTPLKKIPIPQLTVEEMKSLKSILNFCTLGLDKMENTDSRTLISKTNALLYEHYKLTCDEINWINEFERMFWWKSLLKRKRSGRKRF
ncbi:MAG: hypothetical protein ACD_4C00152G0001 [uncultured bacterium (gcode 4)]|uniref:site-specific DNA-methyltransferase (adenine-specific) n=1 Tax=uncultured bacterium (gcode 4) TaxID=1234023 RepID=K2G9D1_9BACT|nr:MAG: hypothetical protein ACD_4C00152G0001 [uncultured bacterium (gcode 4)]